MKTIQAVIALVQTESGVIETPPGMEVTMVDVRKKTWWEWLTRSHEPEFDLAPPPYNSEFYAWIDAELDAQDDGVKVCH